LNIRPTIRRAAAVAVCVVFLCQPSAAASASREAGAGMMRLLRILHQRGSISDAEYEELKAIAEEEAAGTPEAAAPAVAPAQGAAAAPVPAPATPLPTSSGATAASAPATSGGTATASAPATSGGTTTASAKPPAHWYEKLGIRGYTQVRYHSIVDEEGANLDVPADRSVSDKDTLLLRRGRVILSGDTHDHLFVYAQADFSASLSSGDVALQMRDLYGDISIDADKEFRFRVGQSKVPFGFVNLQSSQNRLAVERPDSLNSAVEGERDLGAFFYWAPKDIRARFRTLVSQGLRGSGDYGVFGFGAYTGQGLNRRDANGAPHYVARLSYPFLLGNGQFVELGAQAYTGRFVVRTEEVMTAAGKLTPAQGKNGVTDERVGFTFVWYPQPFGIEAEWNFGQGPQLSGDSTRIHARSLHGGYVQLSWRFQDLALNGLKLGEATPFTRWQYFDGGRKFGRNAAADEVNELDIGIEWQPIPAVELLLAYTPTFSRSNTAVYPFLKTDSAHRIGLQLQFNY
jgi:hypothetical protein